MMTSEKIISLLPYSKPFLFVDEIISVSDTSIEGVYTFREDEFFYKGHFTENPITPGVILTECMAQIGLVCLGIHLMRTQQLSSRIQIAMSSIQTDFLKAVFPGERIRVVSELEYFRFNKLKCKVKMLNQENEVVCRGVISGMMKNG